ncbi:hypothetical protein DI09_123p90 [Mitosporidium daphniae]|uniref:Uncharacterized protein n=1 Tax=Mitosporidium daphniae TaxID=1485682 RepID=A0A098VVR5_9MICR|nr:uncharacterized protein DI09_123p90 [Mitosporidium daphniae]KGG52929.1 hypothetical protein DI09_123p90 [Mitosporidium daphniae]|eukprot:XP_013239365.1 uncharacterized protein DI09_123p90 [Mitosporidium daphniae]
MHRFLCAGAAAAPSHRGLTIAPRAIDVFWRWIITAHGLNFNLLCCLSYPSSYSNSFSPTFSDSLSPNPVWPFDRSSSNAFSSLSSYALQPVLISLIFKEIYKRQMVLLSNCIILAIVFLAILILFVRQNSLDADEKLAILSLQNSSKFPYDLGAWKNIRAVFSHTRLPIVAAIFCCLSRQAGDGIHFENIYGASKEFIKWPPIVEASYLDDDDDDYDEDDDGNESEDGAKTECNNPICEKNGDKYSQQIRDRREGSISPLTCRGSSM